MPRRAARELADDYRFLRQIEHRLQMVNDRQTHSLPDKPEDLARIAMFLGFADTASFARTLIRQLGRVRQHYAAVFEVLPSPLYETVPGTNLDFRGDDPSPAQTIEALKAMGFVRAEHIVARVRTWVSGHVRALRSARARELMDQMLPTILARIGAQPHPDDTFTRFDRFLSAQPAGVQLLSLFQRNPSLMDRIAAVLGASPRLADHLASNPSALEGLLSPEEEDAASAMLRRLRDARSLEEAIELTSRAVKAEDFSISVATMEGRLDADEAGIQRTRMADAALRALLTPVLTDFSARFGRVRGGAMVVVALGKAGGREMLAGSDLDLMLIYDHPPDVTESRGARSMPVSQWFVRLAHAYVAALTAPGVEGRLYDVDMRLRPSGNKGPVAVSLEAFRRYHAHDAWTWERMALTRARVIAGPAALQARIEQAIATAIAGDVRYGSARRRGDALPDAAGVAAGRPVGRQAAAGRPDRGRVHRPGIAVVERGTATGCVEPDHTGGPAAAFGGRRASGGGRGDADPGGSCMAYGSGHVADHRGAGRGGNSAGGFGTAAVARDGGGGSAGIARGVGGVGGGREGSIRAVCRRGGNLSGVSRW